jgi:hypothetical protein
VFKDINENYNVAGGTVNIAARVMGLADKQQIIFTSEAYKNIIDMTEDTTLEDRFVAHGIIEVKHNVAIDVYQYIGHGENYINGEVPVEISIFVRERNLRKSKPVFEEQHPKSPADKMRMPDVLEILKDMPLPEGYVDMFRAGGPNKQQAMAFVEAFKMMDKLMKGVEGGKIIEAEKKTDGQ